MSPDAPRTYDTVVIWGGGAIGGTIAAYLARGGVPVRMVDVVEDHVEACRTRGLRITGSVEEFVQIVPASLPEEFDGIYSRIVLAVKAQDTASALDGLVPHLADDGFVLSAQNGLNEGVIAQRVGATRTMGCFVNFGADWLGPGEILYGGRGEVVVGELDGIVRLRTTEMQRMLSVFEPSTVTTDNIWGHLWGKLGFASMLFATSLTNDGMDASFADPVRFPVFDRLGREVVAVARAEGVTPAPVAGFNPVAFSGGGSAEEARRCIATLATRRRDGAKRYSGFWRDLAVRKRKTEVDVLMGVVAASGDQHGIETPAIDVLISLVHEIERGQRTICWDTFAVLLDVCDRLKESGKYPE